jgi:hypothetical protein
MCFVGCAEDSALLDVEPEAQASIVEEIRSNGVQCALSVGGTTISVLATIVGTAATATACPVSVTVTGASAGVAAPSLLLCAASATATGAAAFSAVRAGQDAVVQCSRALSGGGVTVAPNRRMTGSIYRTGTILRYSVEDYQAAGISRGIAVELARANRCSPQEYINLRNRVHGPNGLCDALDGVNCRFDPNNRPNGALCAYNQGMLERFRQCIAARQQRDSCFGGADPHHEATINQEMTNRVGYCTRAIQSTCR